MAAYLGYTEFENNSWNDDGTTLFGGTTRKAMTFTPGRAHDISVIRLKLIRTGSCGTVTVGLYATDSSNKPTGSALRTATVAQSGIETSATWIAFTFSSSYRLGNSLYAIVLSAAASGVGARYQSTGEYTAGAPWTSSDGGTTWTAVTDEDILFKEYGVPVPLSGINRIQLYPSADGSFKQLVPRLGDQDYIGSGITCTPPSHYLCVADLADAPDEATSTVSYSLHKWVWPQDILDEFMSGEDEGAAGHISGTSGLFRCGVAGYWGIGTSFSTQLAVDYLLRSPTPNYFWKHNGSLPRISQVSSIESDTALTLTKAPTHSVSPENPEGTFKNAWYLTPNSSASADATIPRSGFPMKNLSGEWVYTNGTAYVNGSSGDAINETSLGFDDVSLCGPTVAGRQGKDTDDTFRQNILAVDTVVNDDQLKLENSFTGATHTMPNGTNFFTVLAFKDDLSSEDTATQYCLPTKKDSYLIKNTLNKGYIKEVVAVYRVAMCGAVTGAGKSTVYESFNGAYDNDYTCVDNAYICQTFTPVETHDLVSCKIYSKAKHILSRIKVQIFAVDGSNKPTGSALATAYGTPFYYPGFTAAKNVSCIFSPYIRVTADTTYAMVISSGSGCAGYDDFDVYYDSDGAYGTMFTSDDAGATWSEVSSASLLFEEWGCQPASGTAQPFLYMNSTEVDGTEVTVEASGTDVTPSVFATYREILSRPGGGAFTINDFKDLEVGIILGNMSDPNLKDGRVACTQVYLDVAFSLEPDLDTDLVGLTDHGMATYEWGMDDHGRPVFENGFALFLLQQVRHSKIMNPYRIIPKIIPLIKRVSSIIRRKSAASVTGGRRARSA